METSEDRQIVGLTSGGGRDDPRRLRADVACNVAACFVENSTGVLAEPVAGRWVAEGLDGGLLHGRGHARISSRGAVVVTVDGAHVQFASRQEGFRRETRGRQRTAGRLPRRR